MQISIDFYTFVAENVIFEPKTHAKNVIFCMKMVPKMCFFCKNYSENVILRIFIALKTQRECAGLHTLVAEYAQKYLRIMKGLYRFVSSLSVAERVGLAQDRLIYQ